MTFRHFRIIDSTDIIIYLIDTFYLSYKILLSTKEESKCLKNKLWPFFSFLALSMSLWAVGAKKRSDKQPNGHLPENQSYSYSYSYSNYRGIYGCSVKIWRFLAYNGPWRPLWRPPCNVFNIKTLYFWCPVMMETTLVVVRKIVFLGPKITKDNLIWQPEGQNWPSVGGGGRRP